MLNKPPAGGTKGEGTMEKTYETMYVYRVWYGNGKEAFFTDKDTAKAFEALSGGYMNIWTWEMKIEE